ncbi:MAG: BlaI/MecI/CopY family transcriptional regulator [Phycisphaera sp. RhM]|nr:BlaI/MecI/CopY family transcriptional regulator [Phycisphaera sp. RhM]
MNSLSRTQITKCEAEVMDVVWERERVTVNDVVDAIDRDLAYTTVMTTLRILEEKGIVRRGEKVGRAYTYSAAVTREEVRHGMIHELTDRLFGGSVQSLVLSLLNSDSVSPEDIVAVKKAAAKAERDR